MQSKPIVFILLAASAVFAAALVLKNAKSARGPDWRAPRVGVVRDAASGRPIAGAFVVARWLEREAARFGSGGMIAGRCLDRVVVRSDGDGRFAIPARSDDGPLDADWNPLRRRDYTRDLQVYARGYRVGSQDSPWDDLSTPRPDTDAAGTARSDASIAFDLHDDAADAGQRLAHLVDAAQDFACDAHAADMSVTEAIEADGYALGCLATGVDATAFARLRTALRGHPSAGDVHPCASQHTVSAAAP